MRDIVRERTKAMQIELFASIKCNNRTNSDKLTNKRLMQTYGITLEQYRKMCEGQNNVCLICGKENWQALIIDHSHTTGIVRGLLCHRCNLGIGYYDGDINKLERVIKYLREYGEG